MRLTLVGLLARTWLLGVVGAPSAVRGANDDPTFSGAETVLSQSGTLGLWWLPQPPGFPPLKCIYPDSVSSFRQVYLVGPIVYPVVGITSQDVRITVSLKRRLPGGSLQLVDSKVTTGTATNASPVNAGQGGGGGGGGGGNTFTEDLGSTYVEVIKIEWFAGPVVMSQVELLYTQYQTTLLGSPIQVLPIKNACYPAKPATAQLGSTEGTVGSSIPFTINRFPHDPTVGIYFDGKQIGTVASDVKGNASGKFTVPAAPMGKHTVKFHRYGRSASVSFTIKPRIKVIPSSALLRSQTVNVSLRGYAAHETVRIRWKKNASWVEIGHVTTSSTGSANVKVPTWVPDGFTSVRGDGTYGHAQTNAVSVAGGPMSSSTVKATPSPTPTQPASPTPTPTSIPATSTPEPTATTVPSEESPTSEPAVSENALDED